MKQLLKAVLPVTLLAPGIAGAQSLDYAAFEQLFGEAVTASVTGSPQRESRVAATMTIVTAEDIRRSGARDIPAILRHVAGVDVLRTSNDHSDVSVRGYNQAYSPRLLVLVDGRQVYADYYGFTPWSTVPVELGAIRQIEVVKGPNSALFGFNAVGGVINIVTYDPLDDDVNTVSLAAGTQGLTQASVVSTWKPGDSTGLRLSLGHRNGDDFSTPILPADQGVRRGNERNAVNLDFVWKASDRLRVGMEATYSDAQQAELPPNYAMTYTDYNTSSIKGHIAADTRLGLIQASAYTNQITADAFQADSPNAWLSPDNRVTVAQLQSISKIAAAHTLRLSLEYRDNTMGTIPFPGGDVFYEVAAIGSMWEWRIHPAVTLTNAIRWDRWSLGRSGAMPADIPLGNEDWDRSRTEPSFNSGVVWQVSENDTLRFLIGRGVQLPNLLSLGGLLLPLDPVGYASGVPDLEPTIVENYEISWDRALSALAAELRVSAFHGYSRDVLAIAGGLRPSLNLFSVPLNLGDSRTTGLEISIKGSLRDEWRWGFSYIGQEIDDEFLAGFPVEATLTDFERTTPRHTLKANIGWASGRWEADGYLGYRSGFHGVQALDSQTRVFVPVSGYLSLDGRLAYTLNDRMTLSLNGQNLGNSEQRQTAAPDVERAVFAMFSMEFGSRQ
jgi:iron complex outermembrane receptor protein